MAWSLVSLLRPAQDASAADWIVEALKVFGETVTGLVPAGFEAYVRVFHPAQRDGKPLRWAEIAAERGRVAHAEMQLGGITGRRRAEQPGGDRTFWHRAPALGTMPVEVASSLAATLEHHTTTPNRCWFALWNGFGDSRDRLQGLPTFIIPARSYFLLEGPAHAAVESFEEWRHQSANIWWPDDHAWSVASEIDLRSTYVGCSQACADELLAHPELEAYAIDPGAGIAWASDTVNPEPARG